jgi:(E)-4-hydroxy-3-methylbut-2-enyl-diphosphate synthase
MIGSVGVGGDEPIRVQSMTTTDTGDVEATALQTLRLAEAGCEIVRVTVPNMADAQALGAYRARLEQLGVTVPIVADIHFNPAAALFAADFVEKVRVNPGNYADSKRFAVREYSDGEYAAEIDRIRERFAPLVEKCRRLGRALRIGTNHGSLSDRIMNRHGDSPLGMVESALEFVRICRELGCHDLVLSMKSSNPFVAIQAYRLLAERMAAEGMDYPFHLGVTEAGGGEDGRVKSAIGIGSLLAEGLGDTVRVSLTEDPCLEIPVAQALVLPYNRAREAARVGGVPSMADARPARAYERRLTDEIAIGSTRAGGERRVQVWCDLGAASSGALALAERARELVTATPTDDPLADVAHVRLEREADLAAIEAVRPALWQHDGTRPLAVTATADLLASPAALDRTIAAASILVVGPAGRDAVGWTAGVSRAAAAARRAGKAFGVEIDASAVSPAHAALDPDEALARSAADAVAAARESTGELPLLAVLPPPTWNPGRAVRLACELLDRRGMGRAPLLLVDASAADSGCAAPLLETATRLGGLLADGYGDVVRVEACDSRDAVARAFGVLQATRLRMSRPDYISCPSCGRTLFDLEETTARIQAATGHLKGVKIAIMGCIVNGPGEMADADFGYVGSSPGKVNLYVRKDCVEKNIPMQDADRRLIELIKAHGRWQEPRAAPVAG